MKFINLATEDELSEAVGFRLIKDFLPDYAVSLKFRKMGFGYLKSKCQDFCKISRREPLLLITDLDKMSCPSLLISQWLEESIQPNMFIFRVAVREIESWLLADHAGMKSLLDKGGNGLPPNPDLLPDPKEFLLRCASKAPRNVKAELLPERRARAPQGLGYNNLLSNFVRDKWDPVQASERSNSLDRAIKRLKELGQNFSEMKI